MAKSQYPLFPSHELLMFRDTDIGSEFTNYYLIELYTLLIVFQKPKNQTLNFEVSKNWNESCFTDALIV